MSVPFNTLARRQLKAAGFSKNYANKQIQGLKKFRIDVRKEKLDLILSDPSIKKHGDPTRKGEWPRKPKPDYPQSK
jgi:hypothetical protein